MVTKVAAFKNPAFLLYLFVLLFVAVFAVVGLWLARNPQASQQIDAWIMRHPKLDRRLARVEERLKKWGF
ncbi:hypothetical protein HZA26_03250 [Candidatus Nomurabacteria bacterium]|nr:hypothetical protein [Candidatus Nomurabacteria bacterium]